MALLTSLKPDIRLNTPSAPDVVIERACWRTAKDFLIDTELWKVELTSPMDYTLGATSYDPASRLPTGTEAVTIVSMRWRPTGGPINFMTRRQLDDQVEKWETKTSTTPTAYTLPVPNVARLYPIASATTASAVEMTVSLTITDNYASIPDWLFSKYRDVLIDGVCAMLYLMPQREWSNPNLGAQIYQRYVAGRSEAKAQGDAGFNSPAYQTTYGGI